MANNNKRGLASASQRTRQRVARAGGEARAQDSDMRSGDVGRKGGQARSEHSGNHGGRQGGSGGSGMSEGEE